MVGKNYRKISFAKDVKEELLKATVLMIYVVTNKETNQSCDFASFQVYDSPGYHLTET